jgi:alginate O-acetyltransferase complex protein AlgJ
MFSDFRLAIGDRVFPKVLAGQDGWLFFTGEGAIDDYQNTNLFSDEELATIQQNLDALNSYYQKQGITLLILVAPDKHSIYPEYMPTAIPILGVQSRLDQLGAYLKAHSQVKFLDLRSSYSRESQSHQMYYKTDTHWTEYGVYLAYAETLKALGLSPHAYSDFTEISIGPKRLDLSTNTGSSLVEEKFNLKFNFESRATLKTFNLDDGRRVNISYVGDPSLPRAVVYHDSFFFSVIPLLAEHFSQATYIPHFSGGGIWNLSWVDEQKPDYVIVEFSERYLNDLPQLLKP